MLLTVSFRNFRARNLYLQLDVGNEATVRLAAGVGARQPKDPFSGSEEIDPAEVVRQVDTVISHLPHYVFGYSYFGGRPSQVLRFALREDSMVDGEEKKLLYDMLLQLPRFKTIPSTRRYYACYGVALC